MTSDAAPRVRPARGRIWVTVTVVGLAGVFLALAVTGAAQQTRGERVLAVFDPAADWIRRHGQQFQESVVGHAESLACAVTLSGIGLAVWGLAAAGLQAAPLLLLAVAASLVAWGQVFVLNDATASGAWLYAAGFAAAVALGAWKPLRRLAGLPEQFSIVPGDRGREASPSSPSSSLSSGAECALVFCITVLALFLRTYALNELPDGYSIEMIHSTLLSRTWHGIGEYARDGFHTNTTGIAHLFPQGVFFELLGTSIYSARVAGVFWGILAVPLTYVLTRRLVGPAAGAVGAVLLATAPEQLFWSRCGTTYFSAITVLALVTVNIGVWMAQTWSAPRVLLAALWMPFCRFFYMPGIVMFLFPLALCAHALVFVRGAWRRAWYVLPLLAAGVALWTFSLSFMYAAVHDGEWKFINPAIISGHAPWDRQGELEARSLPEVARAQVTSVARNLGTVFASMTYQTGFSHWYMRQDFSGHPTLINVGLAVTVTFGLGYLFGQLADPRAFAILVWLGLGLLPGLLSNDPADRRIGLVFPALPVIAAISLNALTRLVSACAGRAPSLVAAALAGVVAAGIAVGNLTSHFLLPIGTIHLERMIRFAAPILRESDILLHNLDPTVALTVVFGNADLFVNPETTPCIRSVLPEEWEAVARRPQCDFTDLSHRSTLPNSERQRLRDAFKPRRVTFLFPTAERSAADVAAVQALLPRARREVYESRYPEFGLIALTVDLNGETRSSARAQDE